MYVHIQQNEGTESRGDGSCGGCRGACVFRVAVIQNEKVTYCGLNDESESILAPLNDSNCCQRAETCCHSPPAVNPVDYIPLPVERDEPCHVCGWRPTSVRRGGGGLYLCYDCLKKARRPAEAQPLPGVLDHRTFERVKVDPGRCDVCDTEKRSTARGRRRRRYARNDFPGGEGARAPKVRGCYARLVRDGNAREGVR